MNYLEAGTIDAQETFTLPHTDVELLRLKLTLTPAQRLRAMLNSREWYIGAARARLRAQYPDISDLELTLKIFEEIERVRQAPRPPRFLR